MPAPFRHEALFYAGMDEFLGATVPFARDAVADAEPILVAVRDEKIDALRDELGDAADGVLFADMGELGVNPARIIPAWRDFVDEHGGTDRPVRGIGEPVWPGRDEAELSECHRHESLLNLAFAETPSFTLVCPYDVDALDDDVIARARHSHPAIADGDEARPSDTYPGLAEIAQPFDEPLPEPGRPFSAEAFELRDLRAVRDSVATASHDAGLPADRARDVVLAVDELATNSVLHGGGGGVLRTWLTDTALVCEVRDAGRIDDPLAGRRRPDPRRLGGNGLWLANQLCDLVQVRAVPGGSIVRVHARR